MQADKTPRQMLCSARPTSCVSRRCSGRWTPYGGSPGLRSAAPRCSCTAGHGRWGCPASLAAPLTAAALCSMRSAGLCGLHCKAGAEPPATVLRPHGKAQYCCKIGSGGQGGAANAAVSTDSTANGPPRQSTVQEWEPWEADIVVPLTPGEMQRKVDAIWKHQSQVRLVRCTHAWWALIGPARIASGEGRLLSEITNPLCPACRKTALSSLAPTRGSSGSGRRTATAAPPGCTTGWGWLNMRQWRPLCGELGPQCF